MDIIINSNIPLAFWNAFIETNKYASAFQTPSYYNFFNSIPGYSADVIAIKENHELLALCVITYQKEPGLKGFFTRRAIIYGGPLIKENANKALTLLLISINKQLKNKVIYLETRNLNDYSVFKSQFESAGWNFVPYFNFHLRCFTEEIVWNNLNSNRKRQIKKAVNIGVEIIEANDIQDVMKFYEILKGLYKNKIMKPLMKRQFFEQFHYQNIGKFFLIKFKNKIIGGIMCPILEGKCIYEWYIAGLDSEYRDASPSVMATFAAIQYGCKNGLQRFDFMGAGKPEEEYGVREFKAKFGGDLVEHGRYIKILNPKLYNLGKLGLVILSRMKK